MSSITVRRTYATRGLARSVLSVQEGRLGAVLGTLILAVIFIGPSVAPYGPASIGVGIPLSGPSAKHWLGTDSSGRDVLSRVLSGGQSVVVLPFLGVLVAFAIMGTASMLGAWRRGWLDGVLSRILEVLLAFPPLLLLLLLIATFGHSPLTIVFGVAFVFAPRAGIAVRSATLSVINNDYVTAAMARGEKLRWIMGREVFPNIVAPMLAEFALRITYAIIFVATLSYLGLGAQPPSSNWGLMVAENQSIVSINPWALLAPALCIAALSVAINLIADAITRTVVE